jgi:hypothetical protein
MYKCGDMQMCEGSVFAVLIFWFLFYQEKSTSLPGGE